jgi:hypothetical protein
MKEDEDYLRLLSIFHYVVGGLAGLFACFPMIHVVVGLMFIFSPEMFQGKGEQPPPWFGWIFVIVGSMAIIIGWIFAILILAAGRCLAKRKRYMFCLVVAGIECMFMPFGTALGVFTIIVLMRDSVKQLFVPKDSVAEIDAAYAEEAI